MTEYVGRLIHFPQKEVYRYYWWIWEKGLEPPSDYCWDSPYGGSTTNSAIRSGKGDVRFIQKWYMKRALRRLRGATSNGGHGAVVMEVLLAETATAENIIRAQPISRKERKKMQRDLRDTIRELEK